MDEYQEYQAPQQSDLKLFLSQLGTFWKINKGVILALVFILIISFGTGAYVLSTEKKASLSTIKTVSLQGDTGINVVITPTTALSNNIAAQIPTTTTASTLTATPMASVTPTSTTSATADWLTYTGKYGYSIKYPKDWTANSQTQSDPKIIEYVVFNPPASGSAYTITISHSTRSYQESSAIGATLSTPITVASVSGVKKTEQDSNGNVTIHVVLPIKTTDSLIFYAKNAFSSIFDQMLSTLKFQ